MADEDQSAQEAAQHAGAGRNFVKDQLGGIPITELIMAPIKAAADGQEELCNKYLNFIMKLAYETDSKTGQFLGGLAGKLAGEAIAGPAGGAVGKAAGSAIGDLFTDKDKTKVLKFKLERPQVAPDGTVTTTSTTVQAPLISLVPLPAFTMDEVLVDFTMDISDQFSTSATHDSSQSTASTSTSQGEAKSGGLFNLIGNVHSTWNNQTVVKGKVSTHRENTRRTDVSAKYSIRARAVQQEAADGMAKLTDLFNAMIEPIETDNKLMDQGPDA